MPLPPPLPPPQALPYDRLTARKHPSKWMPLAKTIAVIGPTAASARNRPISSRAGHECRPAVGDPRGAVLVVARLG